MDGHSDCENRRGNRDKSDKTKAITKVKKSKTSTTKRKSQSLPVTQEMYEKELQRLEEIAKRF